MTLVEEFEKDLFDIATDISRVFVSLARAERTIPVDTGLLRAGNQIVKQEQTGVGVVEVTIVNQTRSAEGFDYPTHLDLYNDKHEGWFEESFSEDVLDRAVTAAGVT